LSARSRPLRPSKRPGLGCLISMVENYWGSEAVVDVWRSAVDFRSFDKACTLKGDVDGEEGRFRSYICQRLIAVARWSCVHVNRLAVVVVVRIVVIAIVCSNSRAAHCRKGPTPPTMHRNLMESMRDLNCASPSLHQGAYPIAG
jgi:hypothetical protein